MLGDREKRREFVMGGFDGSDHQTRLGVGSSSSSSGLLVPRDDGGSSSTSVSFVGGSGNQMGRVEMAGRAGLVSENGGLGYCYAGSNGFDEMSWYDEFGKMKIGDRSRDPFDGNVAMNTPVNVNFAAENRTLHGIAQCTNNAAQMGSGEGMMSGGFGLGDPVESYFGQDPSSSAVLSRDNYINSEMNPMIQSASSRCSANPSLHGAYGDAYSLGLYGMGSEGNEDYLNSRLCYDSMCSCKSGFYNELLPPYSAYSSVVDSLASMSPAHSVHHGGNVAYNPYYEDMLSCSSYNDNPAGFQRGCGFDSDGNMALLNQMNFSRMHGFNRDDPSRDITRLLKNQRKLKRFISEDPYWMLGGSYHHCTSKCNMKGVRSKGCRNGFSMHNTEDVSFEQGRHFQAERLCAYGRSLLGHHHTSPELTFESLTEVQGSICSLAKDQGGCRFLQKKFTEGSNEDKMIIFNEIIGSIVELMVNPFGNYLIQKLLDLCDEDQRLSIVHMVTREPGQFVRISLNSHGTRVVQKLIETLKTRKQISLVKAALETVFLDLIKDMNGNHVVSNCLRCLSYEDNKFIFEAATKLCVDLGTHQYGCCVLQKCVMHSKGADQQNLIAAISANAILLAEDPYGNYVVQNIIENKIPTAAKGIIPQFEGHFVRLSTNKFSSNVVEKCLAHIEECRPKIVHELLSTPHFEELVQHPYGNYVIQSALKHGKGHLADSLIAAIRPLSNLRQSPFSKKIFSQHLLKK
ncbi:putative pumilio homolog 7, chloroplastic [Drosera capensis]